MQINEPANSKRYIIAFTGKKGSGKSTAAKYLRKNNYIPLSFASPLKEIALAFGFNKMNVYGTQAQKLAVNPQIGVSGREFMQKFGTEICRKVLPQVLPAMDFGPWGTIWVKIMSDRLREYTGENIVIDDCRFPDEANMLEQAGGIIIRIDRPDSEHNGKHDNHASEQTDQLPWNYRLANDGSINQLHQRIEDVFFVEKWYRSQPKRIILRDSDKLARMVGYCPRCFQKCFECFRAGYACIGCSGGQCSQCENELIQFTSMSNQEYITSCLPELPENTHFFTPTQCDWLVAQLVNKGDIHPGQQYALSGEFTDDWLISRDDILGVRLLYIRPVSQCSKCLRGCPVCFWEGKPCQLCVQESICVNCHKTAPRTSKYFPMDASLATGLTTNEAITWVKYCQLIQRKK